MRFWPRLQVALDALCSAQGDAVVGALAQLVAALRPRRAGDGATAGRRLEALAQALGERPQAAAALRAAVARLLAEKRLLHLFADAGVLANESVFAAARRRLSERLLPPVPNPERLRDVVGLIFRRRDYRWVEAAPEAAWLRLMHELDFGSVRGGREGRCIVDQILESLEVISYRIAAIGLEPEIVRIHPEVERYESPFLAQNAEVRLLLLRSRDVQQGAAPAEPDARHILVLLDQCQGIAESIRRRAPATGASVALTTLLVRLEQNLERARALIGLFEIKPEVDRNRDRLRLFRRLLRAEARKYSLHDLFSTTVDLLAQRVTSNAGHAGEAYMTSSRSEYFALLRSAMGAGLLVALAATIKTRWLAGTYAPFVEAVVYSANYVWCFVLMSALHWSLATKQPAMTANRLAHSMDVDGRGDPLDGLVELIVRTLRSQFIALVGNFLLVIPLPLIFARWSVHAAAGPADADAAGYLLQQIDVASPLTWLWGAITGVWLFAAGLVAGYYDNKAVYDRIPQRIVHLGVLRWLAPSRRERLAAWLENNLGAIAGSVFFGVMLGSTGALGHVLGLPLDTLHVTFSTANAALAMGWLPHAPDPRQWLDVIGGIAAIGAMNLSVSFGLALWVALRSQRVRFGRSWRLLGKLALRLLRDPLAFFWPPAETPRPPG
ncbi:MAG: RNA methyltransferase [Gammaproteobacteria bacterium]|nr:RNA methyltransferase [Gammaproteobacteria bacterium]